MCFPQLFIALLTLTTGIAHASGDRSLCEDAASSQAWPAIQLERIATGLSQPVGLVASRDGSGRLFIVEQTGTIRIWGKGTVAREPFLDLRDRVAMGYEMGLLGLAFHPQFPEVPRLFVNYTTKTALHGIRTKIAEFRLGKDSNAVDRDSERILLDIAQPYPNHKGGHLTFGPDGFLYIGLGDGGSGNDPHDNAQHLDTLLGKMLRIDVDGQQDRLPYRIPPDNPFVADKSARPEIWAYGLRNPWRYSFDAATGLLYVGDVGQYDREEVDVVRKGGNYGWRRMEGSICTPGVNSSCDQSGLERPIFDYPTRSGHVVIGGHVYRGPSIPGLCGAYVYGDYGSGNIFALRYDGRTVTAHTTLLESHRRITSFGEDEHHNLYLVDYQGEIFKIIP
ncbi:MAG TPA: PQQ-dependent sugar dehydrogenase [Nitrospiraceae bacterium]|nr:PQQ-dependent sugar dehydrogenase [Nitrospiraceae bacterium]